MLKLITTKNCQKNFTAIIFYRAIRFICLTDCFSWIVLLLWGKFYSEILPGVSHINSQFHCRLCGEQDFSKRISQDWCDLPRFMIILIYSYDSTILKLNCEFKAFMHKDLRWKDTYHQHNYVCTMLLSYNILCLFEKVQDSDKSVSYVLTIWGLQMYTLKKRVPVDRTNLSQIWTKGNYYNNIAPVSREFELTAFQLADNKWL